MTDWARLDSLRQDWPAAGLSAEADLAAWREGMAMYDGHDDYGSMIRCGGLMCQALRHHLYGDGLLAGTDLPETARRVLFASCFPPPDRQTFPQTVAAQIRLALAIVKKHGWQPAAWGGDGLLGEFIEKSYMVMNMAVAPDPARLFEGDVRGFFMAPAFEIERGAVTDTGFGRPVDRVDRDLDALLEHGRQVLHDAELGDPAARARAQGIAAGLSGSDEDALRNFEEAARLGDLDSMYDAGSLYLERGQAAQGRFWLETAAAQGHVAAMYNLGAAAADGEQFAQAEQWWVKAAGAGDADACAALTELAARRDDADAEFRWSRQGAERGQPFCELRHGQLLMRQRPKDPQWFRQQALPLLTRAVEHGQDAALFLIGIGYGSIGDVSNARLWLRRAEAAGDPDATRVMHENGLA